MSLARQCLFGMVTSVCVPQHVVCLVECLCGAQMHVRASSTCNTVSYMSVRKCVCVCVCVCRGVCACVCACAHACMYTRGSPGQYRPHITFLSQVSQRKCTSAAGVTRHRCPQRARGDTATQHTPQCVRVLHPECSTRARSAWQLKTQQLTTQQCRPKAPRGYQGSSSVSASAQGGIWHRTAIALGKAHMPPPCAPWVPQTPVVHPHPPPVPSTSTPTPSGCCQDRLKQR